MRTDTATQCEFFTTHECQHEEHPGGNETLVDVWTVDSSRYYARIKVSFTPTAGLYAKPDMPDIIRLRL